MKAYRASLLKKLARTRHQVGLGGLLLNLGERSAETRPN